MNTPSRYLRDFFKPTKFNRMAIEAAKIVRSLPVKVVVVSGTSGLLIGPLVALKAGRQLVVVRKRGDSSHATGTIEYNEDQLPMMDAENYIIVDDFVSGGRTAQRIVHEMHQEFPNYKPVAVLQTTHIYDTYTLEDVLHQVGGCEVPMEFDLTAHYGGKEVMYKSHKRFKL